MKDDYIELKDLKSHQKRAAFKKKVSGFKKEAKEAFGRAKVRYNNIKSKVSEANAKLEKMQKSQKKSKKKSFGMAFLDNANKQDLGLKSMSFGFGQPMAKTKKGKKSKQKAYNFGQFGL